MDALLVVDVQNDFLPGGALAVPSGDEVIPVINSVVEQFDLIVSTQDWHPADHGSFASQHMGRSPGDVIDLHGLQQVLWPDHCVQNSSGAAFSAKLSTACQENVFRKGMNPAVDSYSGFFDNGQRKSTGLEDFLRQQTVSRVFVCGLATDYCVRFTAFDARQLGFDTILLEDACRGVNLQPDDVANALADMEAAGIRISATSEI